MLRYIAKRIIVALLLVLGVASLVFFLSRLLPGDPAALFLSPSVPASVGEQLRHDFGLDQPVHVQYLRWLRELGTGNCGYSFSQHQDVVAVIAAALPYTAALTIFAIVIEFLLGIAAALAAVRSKSPVVDQILMLGSVVLYSVPTFWVALLLLQILVVGLGVFPSSHAHAVDAATLSPIAYGADFLVHMTLPALTIALPGAAGIARFLRATLRRIGQEPFVVAARSFGLSENRLLLSTILPNALVPIITLGGLELGTLLTGAVITEQIFALPGMGRVTIMAIFARDYPLIVGCTVVAGVAVLSANLCADILHAVLDPRLRREV